ncbi:50S ribosomal protein L4 [soil metagenome]
MALTVDVRDTTGSAKGSVELDAATFGIEPNDAVLHQVVTAQLAARRAGSGSTLTRAEVRGGGAKPWKQKGTGRARQGSIRSPQWRGGGVALGPKPRSYRQRTPKKMVRLALRSALSDRAAAGRVAVVDGWGIDTPRTKDAVAALDALDLDGRVLVVLGDADEAVAKSLRNLRRIHVLHVRELNAYDILCADWIVFTKDTLPSNGPTPADGDTGTGTAVDVTGASDAAESERSSADDESRMPEATRQGEAADGSDVKDGSS